MTVNEKAILFLDSLIGLEYKYKRGIINAYNDNNKQISDIFINPSIAIKYLESKVSKSAGNTLKFALSSDILQTSIAKYEKEKIIPITEESENYPLSLYNLEFRPLVLYCKGDISLLNSNKILAVVGSRKTATEYLKLTTKITEELSNANVVIVTGVANGGDKSAILGARKSKNLILVMASGLNLYKSEVNSALIEETFTNGLVISEYPLDVPALAYHYPVRNRIIAGLSNFTLIVSGDNKSGARHTANYALEYGKEIMCLPYPPMNANGALCNSLIKDGAMLVESAKDVALFIGVDLQEKQQEELTGLNKDVYEQINNGVCLADDIALKLNVKIFEVMPILSILEIKGLIIKGNGNEYYISK